MTTIVSKGTLALLAALMMAGCGPFESQRDTLDQIVMNAVEIGWLHRDMGHSWEETSNIVWQAYQLEMEKP